MWFVLEEERFAVADGTELNELTISRAEELLGSQSHDQRMEQLRLRREELIAELTEQATAATAELELLPESETAA